MQHISTEALARFILQTSSDGERDFVNWHIENCRICKEEITAREIVCVAKDAKRRMLTAIDSAERN